VRITKRRLLKREKKNARNHKRGDRAGEKPQTTGFSGRGEEQESVSSSPAFHPSIETHTQKHCELNIHIHSTT
jgi:hypothetical protein